MNIETISQLFYYGLALSATKKYKGSEWSLRVNPSSGNLHPVEGYLVMNAVNGICKNPSVFHYDSENHALELRAELKSFDKLIEEFPSDSILVGISTIHWRGFILIYSELIF